MNFEYNENACKVIIDFFNKRIKAIEKDLEFLRTELKSTDEMAVHYAIAESIQRLEFDKSASQLKVREMEDRLKGVD